MNKFKVGQIWETRDKSHTFKIVDIEDTAEEGYPIRTIDQTTLKEVVFTAEGTYLMADIKDDWDLVTLIQDILEVSNTVPKSTETGTSLQDPTLRNDNKQGKLPLHLVPPTWEEFMALVFEFGAKKYPADSWRKYTNVESFLASARRHILYFRKGEDYDPESGLHHLMHSAWNLLALLSQIVDGETETRRAKIRRDNK